MKFANLLLAPLAVLAAPLVEERQSSTSLDALMKGQYSGLLNLDYQ